MSKLTALKKQIAALEAQAERIAKEEMSSAIAKVKSIMAEFNLTIEHLTQTVAGKRAATKTKAKAKKTASAAKYADPKTGKTWTGVGRAPGWIAGAKNRDVFLVGKSQAPATAKKVAAKTAEAVKVAKKAAKPVAKKAVASVKGASKPAGASVATKKKPAGKKAAAKKAAPKAVGSKRAAVAQVESTATPTA
jgi:DNA-binding protein H-NS